MPRTAWSVTSAVAVISASMLRLNNSHGGPRANWSFFKSNASILFIPVLYIPVFISVKGISMFYSISLHVPELMI